MLKVMLFLFLLLFIQLFQEVFSELKRHIKSMYKVQNFVLIFWFGLRIMLSFAEENNQADVFKHCMNSTNSTSCSFTYEHVYNSLTKNESNFNISYALYPDGAKPSFLVRVNVYGPNRTTNSYQLYTSKIYLEYTLSLCQCPCLAASTFVSFFHYCNISNSGPQHKSPWILLQYVRWQKEKGRNDTRISYKNLIWSKCQYNLLIFCTN